MTYEEAISYIHSVSFHGAPTLDRITRLCSLLSDPQKSLRCIHVAGTNGKGSVSAMLASVLRASGVRTGLYTSPYLVRFGERIKVNGTMIPDADVARLTEKVKRAADTLPDPPTVFERITALAFLYYAETACEAVVLECGLGGRLDATNVIPSSLLSVITNVALDHTEILGDTVEKIAAEKGGILKNAPCILGTAPEGAEKVLTDLCRQKNLPFSNASREIRLSDLSQTPEGISFAYQNETYFVPLCGSYQITNLKTVLLAVEELRKSGFSISAEALRKGLASVEWHGRFETLHTSPRVIFDGAHNPDGILAAAATCRDLFPGERILLVSGVMKDKSYDVMAKTLSEIAARAYTGTPQTPRALPAEEWSKALSAQGLEAVPSSTMREAVFRAADDAKKGGGIVLCAGSLYSYAEILDAANSL